MNTFINNKKTKKFILALVVLMLFSFCCPKTVNAWIFDDLPAGIAKVIWSLEKGVLKFLNNIFTADEYKFRETSNRIQTYLTPENIIKGRFILFDANIFKEISNDRLLYDYEEGGAVAEGKMKLRSIIAAWYYALRNFAIVALLSVLVYVGIRMIMSTIAQDKIKYKMMFKDWLVALCLVIVMHYLMIGILNISTDIIEAIGSGAGTDMVSSLAKDIKGILSEESKDNGWKYTNADGEELTVDDAFAKELVLFGVIGYTFVFAVKYLKREFTIIFLILLGPLSCVTYPIDKISDGKAQAFNKWFAEFLYQVIIQPFHLLLYIVLVGSAAELAEANVLYALICFAILIPSEKFIREMFGFKDRLGSPLGAMAGGALAAKAISSLFDGNKGGSSSGKQDSSNVNDGSSLPPKTVNKDGLIEKGKDDAGSEEDQPVQQEDRPELENGDNSEGENLEEQEQQISQEDNPELENSDLPEGVDTTSLAAGAGAAVGAEAAADAAENNTPTETEADRAQGQAAETNKLRAIWDSAWSTHNRRAALKWGSTNRGQRWINRGKKLLGKTASLALRAAGVGAGALVGGGLGLMFGKGAAGAGAGMVLGSKLSGKVISGARGFVNTVGDYRTGYKGDAALEKKELTKFKANRSQVEKARLSFKSNPDNKGLEPTSKQLDQEITDRFELSRYGLDDAVIDRAVGTYQKDRDKLTAGLTDSKAIEAASQKALNETVYAAKLANDYTKKDFREEATMADAVNTISQKFQSMGANKAVADASARRYLEKAATIKGAEIALPSVNKTIDVQLPQKEVSASLGVQQANMSTAQVERMNNITVRLHRAGFNNSEIRQIASGCQGGNVTEVLDRYEMQVEYLNDATAIDQAKITIESRNGGKNATAAQVNSEMRERLILKNTFDVKAEKDITAMRQLEHSEIGEKSQIEFARQFANEHRGRLNNEGHMVGVKRDLIKKLMASGNSSSEKATRDAENIINMAAEYNNEIITWDNGDN